MINSDILKLFSGFDLLWKYSLIFFTHNRKVRVIICPICKSSEGIDFESYNPFCTFYNHQFKVVEIRQQITIN